MSRQQRNFNPTFKAKVPLESIQGLRTISELDFCIEALEEALCPGCPEIFNTDQGSQFTSREHTSLLKSQDIAISMDGRGRAIDNVMIERLWRTVKYEEVYLKSYETGADCHHGLATYLDYYDHERRHQSLARRTPWDVYRPSRANRLQFSI